VGKLFIAKVSAPAGYSFQQKGLDARDVAYTFLTSNPIWTQILNEHGMDGP